MRLDTDRLVGLCAIVVSVASLTVVVYQARLQREQNELERRAHAASVMPYLMMNVSSADVGVAFNLRNAGIGPARIDSVRVLHKGKAVRGDAFDFYVKMRSDPNQGSNHDPLQVGRLVSAGEWVQMIGSGGGDQARRAAMMIELIRLFNIAEARDLYSLLEPQMPDVPLEGAVLEVTYSSVFGQQWVLRSDNMVPQPRATGS